MRAWDLIRYRNFRTFTAPTRLSFSSLAVDPSGEVVCAGSLDSFDVHVWSVQTGQLLDQLSAHEGPVASLSFSANGGMLASGSWDRTVRLWNVFSRTPTSEPLQLQADVLSVAFRPDSKQLAVSTLDGQLSFWSVSDAIQEGGVDGRRDASGGRKISDRRTAANVAGTKSFSTVTYSADGSCVLAGGNSKYICLYEVQGGVLIKKFTVSVNLSLDGTQEFLNSRLLTEAGALGLIDEQGEDSDLENRQDRSLPGASRGDASVRKTRPEVRVSAVAFSPTGRSFCASSTEGLLIYSLDHTIQFDPFDLDVTVTPETTRSEMGKGNHLKALVMAFRLNDTALVRQVFEHVPASDIPLVVKDMPTVYLDRFLRFVAVQVDETPHLEFNLLWIEAVFRKHGRYMKDNIGQFAPEMRAVMRAVARIGRELGKLAEENMYLVEYLLSQPVKEESNGVLGEGNLWGAGGDDDDDGMGEEGSGGEGEWIGFE